MLRWVVVAVLLFPAVTTARGLWSAIRETVALRDKPLSERKRIVYGDWFKVIEEVGRRIPKDAAVDVVMLTPRSREMAVFAGAELRGRDVRFFEGWEAWRGRQRAIFMRDPRAVNAPSAAPPGPAAIVLEAGDELRIAIPR